jgi:hypothetical protein
VALKSSFLKKNLKFFCHELRCQNATVLTEAQPDNLYDVELVCGMSDLSRCIFHTVVVDSK